MKVSIITRHSIPNYGSLLQSYATQKTFEKLGFDAEILNYIRYDERGKQSIWTNCHIGKNGLVNKIKRMIYFALQYPNWRTGLKAFENFQKQYLRLSNTTYGSIDELKDNLPNADIYVTGSDQVWGVIGQSEYDPAYFLKFVPEDKRQIAFSASFGKTALTKELTDGLEELLKNYSSILVREKSAVDIIEQYTNKTAKHILDPTLMLDKNEWGSLCEKTGLEGTDYIFVYQLHHNKEMEKYITRVQVETGLPVYRAHPSFFYALKPGNFIHLPTPGQFLSYIKNAKYIITDSFHGTVFSLIFNKQFVDILPELTGTRIISMMDLLGLKNRILTDLNDFSWLDQTIEYSEVNQKIEKEKKETLYSLVQSLPEKPNTIERMNLHLYCCGCGACANLCPKDAITLAEDEDGFKMPKVNGELCVNCGICYNKCPQIVKTEIPPYKQVGYAAKIKDKEALKKSASGGIFFQCAKEILSQNGIVYGAAMTDELSVIHCRIDSIQNLHLLQGSKYVQSDIGNIYRQVRDDLNKNLKVLFSGTPCQLAGLFAYLGKRYDNLYTVDLICHGVPSQKLFKKSTQSDKRKAKSPLVAYEFRNKEKRGWDSNYKKIFENGKARYGSGKLDAFYKAFLQGEIYRESCYTCRYASMERVGDITLGDFWGIEKELPKFPADKGTSCVIINTQMGEDLFLQILPAMDTSSVALDAIKRHNHNLIMPTMRKNKRNSMYLNIDQIPFEKMDVYSQHHARFKDYISYKVPSNFKRTLKKLLKR